MKELNDIIEYDVSEIEKFLDEMLSYKRIGNNELTEAMRYATLGGGKRVRAFLVLETAKMFGCSWKKALIPAAAIEMVHAYSLIHDDLPCMDNSDYRRGKLSCHKKYSEEIALLAGDTLLTYAFQVISDSDEMDCDCVKKEVNILSTCAGTVGMCGGQFLDLFSNIECVEDLLKLHERKTGALLKAAVLMGYYLSSDKYDANIEKLLCVYSYNIGLVFQIIDDILDRTSSLEIIGKTVNNDEKNGKKTVLSYFSIDESYKLASELTNKAKEAIYDIENNSVLLEFADYLLRRKF